MSGGPRRSCWSTCLFFRFLAIVKEQTTVIIIMIETIRAMTGNIHTGDALFVVFVSVIAVGVDVVKSSCKF